MVILKVCIERFGGLSDFTLDLGEKINVIMGDNETGKSTVCAFIRFVLYGFPKTGRNATAESSDALRFSPWQGGNPSGSIEVLADGRRILIERRAKVRSDEVLVTNADTGEALEEYKSPSPGESLLGVDAATFERTAFVRQSAIAVSGDAGLEDRMRNLVSSAQEDVSFQKAEKRLKDAKRPLEYEGRAGGRVYELTKKREILKSRLEQAKLDRQSVKDSLERQRSLIEEKERLEGEQKRLETELEGHRVSNLITESGEPVLQVLRELLCDLQGARDKASVAKERLELAKEKLSQNNLASEELQSQERELKAVHTENKGAAIPALTTIVGAVLLAVGVLKGHMPAGVLGAAIVLFGAGLLIKRALNKAENGKISEQRQKEFNLKRIKLEAQKMQLDGELAQAWASFNEAQARMQRLTDELKAFCERYAPQVRDPSQALDFARQLEEASLKESQLNESLAETRAKMVRLEQELSELNQNIGAALKGESEPADLEDELSALESELSRAVQARDALNLALSALRDAHSQMRSLFVPAIAKKASAYFESFTKGRYPGLSVAEGMGLFVRLAASQKQLGYFSAGTADAAYLALRLSLCDLLYGDEQPPIIFDDAFARLDDQRLSALLEILSKEGPKRQFIIFSCHSREADMLGIKKNMLTERIISR